MAATGTLANIMKWLDEAAEETTAIRNIGRKGAKEAGLDNPKDKYRLILEEQMPGLLERLDDLAMARSKIKSAVGEGRYDDAAAIVEDARIPSPELATRMAKDQGFDVENPIYHWSTGDFPSLKPSLGDRKFGQGVYNLREPNAGRHYAQDKINTIKYGNGIEDYPGVPTQYKMYPRGPIAQKSEIAEASRAATEAGFNPQTDYTGHWDFIQKDLQKKGFTGLEYIGEVLIFDPKNLRKTNAAFNPAKAESSNLTAGVAGATTAGALAAGMTPEDAEAAVPVSRLIQLGFVDPKVVGNPSAIKSARTKYAKSLKGSRAFAEREAQAAANDYRTVFEQAQLPERTIISPEQMVGQPLVPVRGDQSDIGILSMVGGQPLDEAVAVQGGRKFSKQHAGTGRGWASNEGPAQAVQSKIQEVANITGQQPIAVYNAMGEEATNFSTPVAESMMRQVLSSKKLTKADKAAFDKELRTINRGAFSDWVGLDDPRAMDQLMGVGDFPNVGKLRTAFTQTMGKSGYRDRGFPSYGETLLAVNDPALRGAQYGESGLSMYVPDAQSGLIADPSVHKSYSHVMPGEYLGGLERGVPFDVMFPKTYGRMMEQTTKGKTGAKPYTPEQSIVASNIRKDTFEQTDQQWLDNVMGWLEKNKAKAAAPVVAGSESVMASYPQVEPEAPMTPGQFLTQAGGFRNANEMLSRYEQQNRPMGEAKALPDGLLGWLGDFARDLQKNTPNQIGKPLENISSSLEQGSFPSKEDLFFNLLEMIDLPETAPGAYAVASKRAINALR